MTKLRCVPVEPTKEQVEAGELSLRDYEKHPEGRYFVEAFDKTKEIYQAMLAAAPPARSEFAAWYKNRWPKSVDDDQDPQICALRDYMECAWNAALAETESSPTQERAPTGTVPADAPAPALGDVSNAELDALVERLCHAARMVSPGNPLIRVEWDAASAIVALRQRAEAAERNAARYRWLRENGCNIYGDTEPVQIPQNDGSCRSVDAPRIQMTTGLDAAIDQCRRLERKAKP